MPSANLGYGQQSEATINQANIAMRAMPWYQQQLRAWGQDPGHPTLSKSQSQQILRQAQANGFVVDEGHMEVDDHGNFNPVGHKFRNTMIVIGIAAATVATMGAAGVFAGAAAGAGAGAGGGAAAGAVGAGTATGLGAAGAVTGGMSAALPGALATVPAWSGAGAGIAAGAGAAAAGTAGTTGAIYGGTAADVIGGVTPAAAGGLTAAEALRYGLPVAGNLVSGLIQSNAIGKASDAQQKYLEEALAYEKEKDAYARTTEATRYGNYQGRIGPYIATGTSANDRMAALLGLPAGNGRNTGGSSASANPSAVPVSPEITTRLLDNYKTLGYTPTGRGSGPTDSAYYADQIAATGGLSDANARYWFGPQGRIANDANAAGTAHTTSAPTVSSASGGMVTLRAPDGSTRAVPQAQVAHYTALGATLLGAA